MQFQGKLMYLGEAPMEFKNDRGEDVKMMKLRFMVLGSIDILDFTIMDEAFKEKMANTPPHTLVEGLFDMVPTTSKDPKPKVKLLDISIPGSNALKQKQ